MFTIYFLSSLLGDFVNGLSDVLDVVLVDTSNIGSTIGHHVDGIFSSQSLHLSRSQAGEAEHANLLCNVTPVLL